MWVVATLIDAARHEQCRETGDGELVRVTGRMRDNSYKKGGETVYATDRIVDEIHRLHKKES